MTSSSSQPTRQGQLTKQGGRNGGWKTWRDRWFVLDQAQLAYYKNEPAYRANVPALGTVPVGDIVDLKSSKSDDAKFYLRTGGASIALRAPSRPIKLDWIRAIRETRASAPGPSTPSGATNDPAAAVVIVARAVPWADDSGGRRLSALLAPTGPPDPAPSSATSLMTVDQLVDRLVVEAADPEFQAAFLLYRRAFISAGDLLARLEAAFDAAADDAARKVGVVHLVCQWIEASFDDFDRPLRKRCRAFLRRAVADADGAVAISKSHVEAVYDRAARRAKQAPEFRLKRLSARGASLADGPVDVTRIAPEDVAEWMTAVEHDLLRAIRPIEFVDRAWTRSQAPGIQRMTRRFNQVSYWVASQTLSVAEAGARQRTMQHLIKAAAICLDMCNYFGAAEIVTGLGLTPVYRLADDWRALNAKAKARFVRITEAVADDDNFAAYRKAFRDGIGKAQVPMLAVTLKDLFQLDSLPSRADDDRVNWGKYQRQWAIVSELVRSRKVPYRVTPSQDAADTLERSVERVLTEDDLFALSHRIAPPAQRKPAPATA